MQRMAREGGGRKSEPKAPQKPGAGRNQTIRTDPKKGEGKTRVAKAEILHQERMGDQARRKDGIFHCPTEDITNPLLQSKLIVATSQSNFI